MGRTQRAMTSLVAAVPAGFLCYLLLMVFLNQADSLKVTMQALAGVTLLCSAFVAAMPFFLLIPGRRKKPTAAPAAMASDSEAIDAAVDVAEGEIESAEFDSASPSEDSDETDDLAATSDFILDGAESESGGESDFEIPSDASISMDNFDAVDFEEIDDEPAPKKGKKK